MPSFSPELLQFTLGILLCLFGWVCYWGGLHVLGGLVGISLAVSLAWIFVRAGEMGSASQVIYIVAAVIGAVLGIILLRQIHYGFFLLVGGMIGLVIGLQVGVLLAEQEFAATAWLKPASGGIGAIAGALLFLLLSRHIIILITSAMGAVFTATAYTYRDPLLILLIALFLGLIVQTGIVRYLGLGRKIERS